MSDSKPKVLILGGCGFIGRHLVMYLHKSKLASKVCVADKQLFQIAGLSEAELAIYKSDFVSFRQADLQNPVHVEKTFTHEGGNYDYVVNLAAATKYSQAKEVYEANIVNVAKACVAEAAKHKIKRFIQVSTGQVYKAEKKPSTETSTLKPWTMIAQAHADAEAVVQQSALNYIIVRPAIVYGTGDVLGITPRLLVGSIYKETGKTMQSLYTKDLRTNTVHADDAAKALHFLFTNGKSGDIYNLADKGDTDQGKVNKCIEAIYGIKTGFVNALKMTAAAAMGTKFLCSYANDQHLKPFSDACKKYGVGETPLTPYLDEELIKDTPTGVDGSKIESLGFKYDHPDLNPASLKEVLQDYVQKKYFPKELLG